MNRRLTSVLSVALLIGIGFAQDPAQSKGGSEPKPTLRFSPGAIIRVELVKSIDAKKAKAGDEVAAKTIDDFLGDNKEMVAPRGLKVVGHVAEVSPREGDSVSKLGLAFDKIVMKDGTDVPIKVAVQAIGVPQSGAGLDGVDTSAPDMVRGAAKPSMGIPGREGPDYGSSTAGGSSPLSPNAQGVVGIAGVSLSAGSMGDSVVSSQKKNVKLDSGTQVILRTVQ